MSTISYTVIIYSPDYLITIIIECKMKNEKCFQMSTIDIIFVAIYSPDYIITITVEIGSKNGARNIYIHVDLEELPYMVSLIT